MSTGVPGLASIGTYAYAIDASTGKVHWQAQTQGGGFLRGGDVRLWLGLNRRHHFGRYRGR